MIQVSIWCVTNKQPVVAINLQVVFSVFLSPSTALPLFPLFSEHQYLFLYSLTLELCLQKDHNSCYSEKYLAVLNF